jgi:GAF domain-containing protein
MSNRTSFLRIAWERLTAPDRSIIDAERRRRAQVLAALALTTLVALVVLWAVAAPSSGRFRGLGLVVMAFVLGVYLLSRTRWPEAGSILMTFGPTAAVLVLLAISASPAIGPQAMVLLVLPVLASTLVLSATYTIALALISIVSVVALALAVPTLRFSSIPIPSVATVLLAALTAVAAAVRERDIDTIGRQSRSLAEQSHQLEGEARRLAAIAEVGRVITGKRDLDALLNEVVNLIVLRFDFYHAQVFLVDEPRRYAVLKASTGQVGKTLLANGHRLAVGSQSVIGQVVARGEPVIAADTDTDPVHRRNELLPDTHAEMALPLRISGRVIGVLDVQGVTPSAFKADDIATFQAIADQLAIAIENVRLFEQAERDLQDISALNRQLTGEAWRSFMQGRSQTSPVGFKADAAGIQPVTGIHQPAPAENALSVPLTLRGETIGVLDVRPRDGTTPDEETRSLIEAVAERVAMALDSTRLSEQAQRQAAREQILSHLSAELQAVTDMDVMLRVAAAEASRALNVPRGFVHLTMEYGTRSGEAE